MYRAFKRLVDFIIASVAILILTPLLLPIIVGLKLTGEGYVFYFQERVGFKNKIFNIWKFATMLKNSPNMAGGLITMKRDPRITPMGAFLRKTKINELPQLANILLGEMSIIGPRPVMQKSFDQYPPKVRKIIYNSKPGLTGIGSIVFRDEEEIITKAKEVGIEPWEFYKTVIYPYKGELEAWYQRNIKLSTDIKILFLTVWAIFFPKSQLHYQVFKDLPSQPEELVSYQIQSQSV
ncbi:MAG: sugar transferase [Bacteroidota bacterium]